MRHNSCCSMDSLLSLDGRKERERTHEDKERGKERELEREEEGEERKR